MQTALRRFAGVGRATTEGAGWDAGWRLEEEWVASHLGLLGSLSEADREALEAAGQLANEMVTRWSKKVVASAPMI